ncbi:MAG: cytochrome P450 [Chloroflexi bacterium]|nr:cytochrome P450 [Chloroflexota bacterium]
MVTQSSLLTPHYFPPGPAGHPLLGVMRDFQRDPLGYMSQLVGQYGDLVRYRFLPGWYGYIVSHPDHVKYVLQDNNRNYSKQVHPMKFLQLLVGEGLLTSEGEFWRQQRRLAQPAFHRQRLAALGEMMTGTTQAMLDRWQTVEGRPLDVDREMMRLTLRVAARALFDVDVSDAADRVGRAFTEASEYYAAHYVNPLSRTLVHLPTRPHRRFKAAVRTLDQVVQGIIQERRRSGEDRGDLLSMLLLARDADTGQGMSDRQVRDEVMTLLLAGHETTSNALTWTWYLLDRHPEAAEKLRAELAAVLGGRAPAMDDLPHLPTTRLVLEETLRLYPPAWGLMRLSEAADQIGGYDLPARTYVVISPYLTHRHPAFWPDPERFDPERFTPEQIAGRPRYAYIPFGGGPRQCIGNTFAMVEAQLVLATVAQLYRLRLVPGR